MSHDDLRRFEHAEPTAELEPTPEPAWKGLGQTLGLPAELADVIEQDGAKFQRPGRGGKRRRSLKE